MDRSSASSESSSSSQNGPAVASEPQGQPEVSERLLEDIAKLAELSTACQKRDFDALVVLATSKGGFVNDDIRREAWPLLLGADKKLDPQPSWEDLPPHHDEDQVKLDVNRSFVYYPKQQSEKQLDQRKQELQNVITQILRRYPQLGYFQGYHDIAQVLLLVLGYEHCVSSVTRLTLLRIRDFMLPTLSAAISHLRLLPGILYKADPELCRHIQPSLTQPFFALASTLTLYAHDIQEYSDIARLFDFLLAREPVIPIYLFAAIILSRKQELIDTPQDEPEMLHFILSKLPQPFDLEQYIASSMSLYKTYPPSSLPFRVWANVSSYSVLKTARDPREISEQDLGFAQKMFEKHAAQVRRTEALQKMAVQIKKTAWLYRRPVGAASLAVFVGALAWWMGRLQQGGGINGGGFLSSTPLDYVLRRFFSWR